MIRSVYDMGSIQVFSGKTLHFSLFGANIMFNPVTFLITFVSFLLFIIMIPTLTGCFLSKRFQLTQHFYVCYPAGCICLWACSQLLLVPLVFLKAPFYLAFFLTAAVYILGGTAGLLTFSVSKELLKDARKNFLNYWKSLPDRKRLNTLISLTTTLIIIIAVTYFQQQQYSDVHYIVSAVDMLKSGRMFLSNPASGAVQNHFTGTYLADLVSPWAFQYAFLGALTLSKPIVAAHMMLPVQMIILCTCIYQLFAQDFADENPLIYNFFFLVMWMIQVLGYYSIYSAEAGLMTRAWQPCSVIASVGLPLIIYLFFLIDKDPGRKIYYYALAAINLSMCYMHITGMLLGLFACLGFAVIYTVRKKTWSIISGSLLSLIPNLLYWIISGRAISLNAGSAGTGGPVLPDLIINSFRLYTGNQLMILLGILSAFILCIYSRKQSGRLVYPVILSLALAFVFLIAGLLPAQMMSTSIYWLFPEALLTTAAFIYLINNARNPMRRLAGYGVFLLLLFISGSIFYKEANMYPIENIQKMDRHSKEIYDYILDQDLTPSCFFCDEYIWAARQYSGSFIMPYAYNEDGSLTFAYVHDQSLPTTMTRNFPVSYFICHHASLSHTNYIVVKANQHLQIRYLRRYGFYASVRLDDTIIYSHRTPQEINHQQFLSKQLHLGANGFYKALRRMDNQRLSIYNALNKN